MQNQLLKSQHPIIKLSRKFSRISTALLRTLPAEPAHRLGMAAMSKSMHRIFPGLLDQRASKEFAIHVPGLGDLRHPLGLAAGLDKEALCPWAFNEVGFSFVEIGTVTPEPQPGNPKPRMFRQPECYSLINRMGFNSDGRVAVGERLSSHSNSEKHPAPQVLGINCGKNKHTSPDAAVSDYVKTINYLDKFATYFVVNLSSPNTPGLRDLANPEFAAKLAAELGSQVRKVWVKLDPDLETEPFRELVSAIDQLGFQGLILTNTRKVVWPEQGGLSGHPLSVAACKRLEEAWSVHKGRLPMIASGGILTGHDVYQRLARGASAAQIYTALIYRGPWAVWEILEELYAEMQLNGKTTVSEIIGTHY